MTDLLAVWGRLTSHGEAGDGYVRLRLADVGACATYAAKSAAGGLEALVLEVDSASIQAETTYPETRGLHVGATLLTPGRLGRTRLIVALTDGRFRNIFVALATDVVSKLVEARDEASAVAALVARLARWQAFLRHHGPRGLTTEERRGLFGELTLLRNHLVPRLGTAVAVRSWKGASHAHHDFQFPAGSIEVKTSSAAAPHSFHVASVSQLAPPRSGHLHVFFALVEETEAGELSLPELVDAVRAELDGRDLTQFEDQLVEAGYVDTQRDLYSSPRYSLRRVRFFHIAPGFPRISEADLPSGVEAVKYQVALAACAAFEVPGDQVLDAIAESVGGAG